MCGCYLGKCRGQSMQGLRWKRHVEHQIWRWNSRRCKWDRRASKAPEFSRNSQNNQTVLVLLLLYMMMMYYVSEKRERKGTHREFVRRRRRRGEVDVEVHGAAEGGAEMFEPLVVPSEHLRTAYLRHLHAARLHLRSRWFSDSLSKHSHTHNSYSSKELIIRPIELGL